MDGWMKWQTAISYYGNTLSLSVLTSHIDINSYIDAIW